MALNLQRKNARFYAIQRRMYARFILKVGGGVFFQLHCPYRRHYPFS